MPERLDVKHATFRQIEPAQAPEAVVASSASGLTVAKGFGSPDLIDANALLDELS